MGDGWAYYNEIDPYCCEWLGNLMDAGLIPFGYVDSRSIVEVQPDDLKDFTQCHFFAGIGGWCHALRLAGWPDTLPVWSGSCPCQPFSAARKRLGTADKRHLWPEFRRLISECHPPTVFGEQVASKDGRLWLAGVRADLEELGYAVGAADLCAAGIGAPHIRQRLWWVAESEYSQRGTVYVHQQDGRDGQDAGRSEAHGVTGTCGEVRGMSNRLGPRLEERAGEPGDSGPERPTAERGGDAGRVAQSHCDDGNQECENGRGREEESGERLGHVDERSGYGSPLNYWSAFDLIPCLDGKARRVEPGTFPLAHGVPARVGKLRAAGNAIVPQVAAEFVKAWLECRP